MTKIKCPSCPGTFDLSDQAHCPFCGRLPTQAAPQPPASTPARRTSAEKKCPRCAEIIKAEATVCRYCQHDFTKAAQTAETEKNIQYGCIGCLSAVVIVVSLMFLISVFSKPKTVADRCEDHTMGFVMAQQFIKDRLKAPTTAKFPTMSEPGNMTRAETVTGGCGFIVDTYVDAQNGFGAMIRSRYTVTVAPREDGEWELIHFEEH